MKPRKFSNKLIVLIMLLGLLFIESLPRIMVNLKNQSYVVVLDTVYYRMMNINSPTNHFAVVPVVGAATDFTRTDGPDCIKDAHHTFCNGVLQK